MPASAASWQQIISDTFARPNTYLGAAGNETSAGNNWIDTAGETWRIHGGMLEGTGSGAPGSMLLRPFSEAGTEQRVIIKRQQNLNSETFGAVLRVQSDGSRYFVYQGGPALRISRVSSGGGLSVMFNGVVPPPAAGDSVSLDASVVTSGGKPVVAVNYIDSTTGLTRTFSAIDTSTAAVSGPGQCGIDIASASTFDFRQVTIYSDNPSAAVVTPTAVHAGAVNTLLLLVGTGTTWTKSTTFTLTSSANSGAALGNVGCVDATHFRVILANAGSAGDSLILRDSTNHTSCAVSVTIPAISVIPTQVLDSTAETVLTVQGSDQTWTTSAPQFQVSGVSGVSIVRTKVLDSSTAQVTVKTGDSTGVVTLRDVNTKYPTALSFSVIHAVKVTDPNILLSPYNWDLNGSAYADSNYAGAYVKLAFDTTSPGPISIVCDPTPNLVGGQLPGNYPTLGWSLNPASMGGKWNFAQLDPSGTPVSVAANAPAGHYELWVYVKSIKGPIGGGRWNPSGWKARLLGIEVSPTAKTVAIARRSTNAIAFGDSITQGCGALGFSSATNDDAMQSWVRAMADALDAEYGNIGLAGQQWSGTSTALPSFFKSSNVPHDTFSYYEAGRSRLVSGKLSPAPDYVFVNMGTNDMSADISANIEPTIAGLRAISGANAEIFVILPFGGFEQSLSTGIPAGFHAYVTDNPDDTKVFLLDCGTSIAPYSGLNSSTGHTENLYAFDGVHPKADIALSFGAKIAQLVRRAIDATPDSAVK